MSETVLVSISIPVASALAWFAYNHPKAYNRYYLYLLATIFLVQSGLNIWSFAVTATHWAIEDQVSDRYAAIITEFREGSLRMLEESKALEQSFTADKASVSSSAYDSLKSRIAEGESRFSVLETLQHARDEVQESISFGKESVDLPVGWINFTASLAILYLIALRNLHSLIERGEDHD